MNLSGDSLLEFFIFKIFIPAMVIYIGINLLTGTDSGVVGRLLGIILILAPIVYLFILNHPVISIIVVLFIIGLFNQSGEGQTKPPQKE